MSEVTICQNITNDCSCQCNKKAYFPNNRLFTAESLTISGNSYTFSYLITNPDPSLSNIIFCIQCPTNVFEVSSGNTTISLIGNPNSVPITYTLCTTTPCPDNSYTVSYEFGEESSCCFYQGIKIDVNSSSSINEIQFILTFTVPSEIKLCYQSGVLRIKSGDEIGVVNYVCMPGCELKCNVGKNICEIWSVEKDIVIAKKNAFLHYSNNLFPEGLDLSTLNLDDLENRIRQLEKLEKSTAKLNCNIAKVLKELNENNKNKGDFCCN